MSAATLTRPVPRTKAVGLLRRALALALAAAPACGGRGAGPDEGRAAEGIEARAAGAGERPAGGVEGRAAGVGEKPAGGVEGRAAGVGEKPAGARGAPLEVLIATPPLSLDPRFLTDTSGVRLSRLVHAGLFGLDPDTLEPVPLAAASWSWEGPLSLRIALRADVRFASGAPFEAEDVCATLRALADPARGSPHRTLVTAIGACEPLSPKEVRLRLGHERATMLTDLELPILRRDEATSARRPEGGLDGLGPYALARADGGSFELRARPGGALPEPARDLNVRVVRDENARALRLLAGRADVVPNGLSAPLLGAIAARGALVRSRPGANLTYLLPHHERVPFRDPRARRALSLGVDRERLARTLFEGRAQPARSFLPPGSWAYPADAAPLLHDAGAAARLFAELGRPSATLLVSTDRARGVLARAIAQDLVDAGLRVEVVTLELGALVQRLTAGDYELALLQMPEITEPQLLEWFFHSRFIPDRGGVGANRARYRNAAVDDRLARAALELDRERRRALFHEALGLMGDDLPVVPLFHEDQIVALSARAAAFMPSAEGRWLGLASVP